MNSDNEQEEEIPPWQGVTATVILINIFDPEMKNVAAVGLDATCRVVRQYLRLSNSHLLGVCLYGMEDTNTSAMSAKSVTTVFPLTAPTLDDFNKLRKLEISSYRPTKELHLSDVLWHCSKMFANCKKRMSTRTVTMLTRLEKPPAVSDQKPTLKRVVDLVDAGIDIKIINVSPDNYNVDSFYEKFLIEANRGNDFALPKPVYDSKEIEQLLYQQSHRHLAVARVSFEIGDGVSIGVGVYNLLIRSTQSYFKKVNLDRETNAIVSSVTKTMKASTVSNINLLTPMDIDDQENETKQVPLLKSEILHYKMYGGEHIEFTDDEMKIIRNPFGPPMLKLLGFKPAGVMCKEKWYLKTSQFLFPNESLVEGSTVAFKALHKACMEMSVVAICVLCTRVNSKPYIVALSPCSHPHGLDVVTGFDIIQIPFVENVRDIPIVDKDDEEDSISIAQKTQMKNIMTSLQFDYKPDMFQNPQLQSKYRTVEIIALDEDIDRFVDTTKPNRNVFQDLQDNLFEELFGPFGPVAHKRAASSRDNGSVAKKSTGEIDESVLKDRVKHGTVHQFTVTQLKDLLRKIDDSTLPALTGLKKAELVDLVYKHCKD